jgi:hypothetical protein
MRRFGLGITAVALMFGFGSVTTASAEPGCASETTVRIQGEIVPAPVGAPCDSDASDPGDGLLGNAPIVGNLPGLGGIL